MVRWGLGRGGALCRIEGEIEGGRGGRDRRREGREGEAADCASGDCMCVGSEEAGPVTPKDNSSPRDKETTNQYSARRVNQYAFSSLCCL